MGLCIFCLFNYIPTPLAGWLAGGARTKPYRLADCVDLKNFIPTYSMQGDDCQTKGFTCIAYVRHTVMNAGDNGKKLVTID